MKICSAILQVWEHLLACILRYNILVCTFSFSDDPGGPRSQALCSQPYEQKEALTSSCRNAMST